MNITVESGKESELIAAILAGDTQLYHQLIRPYERSIYIVSLSLMKNEKDAEDVAQQTFIGAFRNLWKFRGESKFGTWLISIALNEVKHRLRRRAIARIAPLDGSEGEDMLASPALLRDWRELPLEILERQEIKKLLQQAVESLPNIYLQVFLLRDVEQLNGNETAQILDISTSLVKVRLHRARMMLQRLLAIKLKADQQCIEEEVVPVNIAGSPSGAITFRT